MRKLQLRLYNMKIFNKFIWSKTEPHNKNDIWFDGAVFRLYSHGDEKEDAWKPFTIDPETAEKLKNMADNLSSVYQEILIPGKGITIDDNNVISVNVDFDKYATNDIVGGKLNIFIPSTISTYTESGANLHISPGTSHFYYCGKLYNIAVGETVTVESMPEKITVTRTGYDKVTIKAFDANRFKSLGGVSFGIPVSIPEEIVDIKNKVESTIVESVEPTHEFPYATRGELTELSLEVSGLSERVDELEEGGQGGEQEVFWATYGTTTYDEIMAAHNEGKVVLCYFEDTWVARLEKVQSSQVMLQAYAENSVTRLICKKSGAWAYATYSTEHSLSNLDNGNVEVKIGAKSAEVATPQYVENLLGVIINGEY